MDSEEESSETCASNRWFRCPRGHSHVVSEDEQPNPSSSNRLDVPRGFAAVYHYVTKSKQDFDDRFRRGGGAGITRPCNYLQRLDLACSDTRYEAAL